MGIEPWMCRVKYKHEIRPQSLRHTVMVVFVVLTSYFQCSLMSYVPSRSINIVLFHLIQHY